MSVENKYSRTANLTAIIVYDGVSLVVKLSTTQFNIYLSDMATQNKIPELLPRGELNVYNCAKLPMSEVTLLKPITKQNKIISPESQDRHRHAST